MEIKKIVEDLIDNFLEAGKLSLELRKKGLKKKSNLTIHLLVMEILKLINLSQKKSLR